MKKFCKALAITILLFSNAEQIHAACQDEDKAEVINYVPTVLTGAASLAASGLGYIVDGAIYVTGNVLTSAIVCAAPVVGLSAIDQHLGSQALHLCSDMVIRSNSSNYFDTDLGKWVFVETRNWRCPMFVPSDE